MHSLPSHEVGKQECLFANRLVLLGKKYWELIFKSFCFVIAIFSNVAANERKRNFAISFSFPVHFNDLLTTEYFQTKYKKSINKILFLIGDLVFIIKKVLNSFFCRNFKSNVENYNVLDIHSKQVYDIITTPNN